MLRHLRIALASLAAFGAVSGAVWLLFASPWLRYQQLQVEGHHRAGVAQLRHLANLPEGAPLARLSLDEAVAGVERHPWVRRATARRSFPDTVVITVEERVPVALVQLDKLYLVDGDGTIFTQAHEGDLDHPLLSGIDTALADGQPEVARRLVAEGLAWLSAAQNQGGLAEKDLSELRFDTRTGYTLTLRNGGEVLLGFADRERVTRLSQLTAQGLDLSAPHRVDLASERLAVVTPL